MMMALLLLWLTGIPLMVLDEAVEKYLEKKTKKIE